MNSARSLGRARRRTTRPGFGGTVAILGAAAMNRARPSSLRGYEQGHRQHHHVGRRLHRGTGRRSRQGLGRGRRAPALLGVRRTLELRGGATRRADRARTRSGSPRSARGSAPWSAGAGPTRPPATGATRTRSGCPFFIVTHRPEEEPDGGHFKFVAGVDEAVERAREAADGKDVSVMGGADVIRQALDAGLVDELSIIVAPVVLGGGKRLFDGFTQVARAGARRRAAVAASRPSSTTG